MLKTNKKTTCTELTCSKWIIPKFRFSFPCLLQSFRIRWCIHWIYLKEKKLLVNINMLSIPYDISILWRTGNQWRVSLGRERYIYEKEKRVVQLWSKAYTWLEVFLKQTKKKQVHYWYTQKSLVLWIIFHLLKE